MIKQEILAIRYFGQMFQRYLEKRIGRLWRWLEARKDVLVAILVAKRGTYQRPFMHTSLLVIVAVGTVAAPIIRDSYDTQATELSQFEAPSEVLTSFNDQETQTEISEKPRDQVINYKVEAGDTLSQIAQKYGISTDSIKWANPKISEERLKPGDEISIPPVTGVVVKIHKGDTIYSLAKKYKVDAQNIVNWPFNDYTDLDTFALAVGQTLVIPNGVVPEAAPVYSPRAIAEVGTVPGSGQFSWPTQGLITQYYVSYHPALDIANRSLPAIAAADSGKVILVEYARYGYGHHVIIDHGNGFQTLYAHMSTINVQAGQNVAKGAIIGRMGSTGRSTGPHLHFEIRKGGAAQNPLNYLK